MLLGTEIHIHTDHKNLTYTSWMANVFGRILSQFHYIKSDDNVLADFLSWTPLQMEKGHVKLVVTPDDDTFSILMTMHSSQCCYV